MKRLIAVLALAAFTLGSTAELYAQAPASPPDQSTGADAPKAAKKTAKATKPAKKTKKPKKSTTGKK